MGAHSLDEAARVFSSIAIGEVKIASAASVMKGNEGKPMASSHAGTWHCRAHHTL
jgi:hypothetical protein